ncbi:MAG: hypothetical protein ACYC6T_16485 [Thermoleophilia bacterium]
MGHLRTATLYQEVWAEFVRDVAERCGISDVALGKIRRKLAVPVPGRGYWAKVKAGKAPKTSPLPPLPPGVDAAHVAYRSHSGRRSERPPDLEIAEKVEREKTVEARIVVPTELEESHELVATAARLLEKRRPKDGFVSCRARRCLDLRVAPDSLDRALRIMDALLKALEARDLQVEVTPISRSAKADTRSSPEGNVTRVFVDDEWIPFGLREELDVIRYPVPEPPKGLEGYDLYYWKREHRRQPHYLFGGRLALFISTENLGIRRTWRDAQRQRVENCLNTFVAHLYKTAQAVKEERAAQERRRLQRIEDERLWALEQERRREAERRHRVEEQRRRDLGEQLDRWRLAGEIRAFLGEARATLSPEPDEELQEWLAWADGYAARLDPLTALAEVAAVWQKAEEEPVRRW